MSRKQPPLVTHIIHRLAIGGLENGLVNLINNMPPERYRHSVVCLTDFTDFRHRIQRPNVPLIALNKREGHDFRLYNRLWTALRNLRPSIVHTRNLSSLEYQVVAALDGIPGRIHGEHGRDVYDLDGSNIKYNLLRKATRPFVHHYISVSLDLTDWLAHRIGVRPDRITQIYNGVDCQRFYPCNSRRPSLGPVDFIDPGSFVVGTVGRMEAVKDQLTLVRAFRHLLDTEPSLRNRIRLVLIGDGILRKNAKELLRKDKADHLAWLPGERSDIPDMLRGLNLFVLPSLAEGVSNTILEAMASGLPVVATSVGGNPELVVEGKTGMLVPPENPAAMAEAIRMYITDKRELLRHGQAGRKRVEEHFSTEAMVNGYLTVYDTVLTERNKKQIPPPRPI